MSTTPKTGISDRTQAILAFMALILGPLGLWLAGGAPTDHTSLGLLGSAFISAIILSIKEILGTSTAAVAATTTNTPTKAV